MRSFLPGLTLLTVVFNPHFATAATPGVGQVGSVAYEWTNLKGLDSTVYNLKDFHGKVVLLFPMQFACGGCKGNAARIGEIALKYQGNNFQALAVDITNTTPAKLYAGDQNFNLLLTSKAKGVHFPILSGVPTGDVVNSKWTRYDSYRDVFIVIDHTGMIVSRVEGNFTTATTEANYQLIDGGIAKAIANVPTSLFNNTHNASVSPTLQASKGPDGFSIVLNSSEVGFSRSPIQLLVLDAQGHVFNTLKGLETEGRYKAEWKGLDSRGNSVSPGIYFISAFGKGLSLSLPISISN